MVRFLIKVKLIVDRILIGWHFLYLEISEGEVDFIEYKTKKKKRHIYRVLSIRIFNVIKSYESLLDVNSFICHMVVHLLTFDDMNQQKHTALQIFESWCGFDEGDFLLFHIPCIYIYYAWIPSNYLVCVFVFVFVCKKKTNEDEWVSCYRFCAMNWSQFNWSQLSQRCVIYNE